MGSNCINSLILVLICVSMAAIVECSNGKGGSANGHGNYRNYGNCSANWPNWVKIKSTCKQVEAISRRITWKRVADNPVLPAKLIRMQFHDCFVRGCDGSILLDSTKKNKVEKEAIPNQPLIGYDVIDEIKAEVEKECPGQVSCADILALATRDAISFQFKKPLWPVFFGRKDGRVSMESEANRDLPSPFSNFTTLQQQFESHGLDIVDLVALLGAHTIGSGHCIIIASRLFNFTGKGDTDPSIDKKYAEFLKKQCKNPSNPTTTVEMDPGSSKSWDTHFFVALNQKKGLFQSDATLLTNPEAARLSKKFEDQKEFFNQFAQSMIKMSLIGGTEGEIRNNCRRVN